MTILQQPEDGQLSGSPILYYVEELLSVARFTCAVRLWRGDKTPTPADPIYTLRKVALSGGKAVFDVAQFVKDEIYNGNAKDLDNALFSTAMEGQVLWMECTFSSFDSSGANIADVKSNTIICYGGYGFFADGVNASAPFVMNSNRDNILSESTTYLLSIANNTAAPTWTGVKVAYDIGGEVTYTNLITDKTVSKNNLLYVDVSPSNFLGNFNSGYTVQVMNDITVLETINITVDQECRYQPYTVAFVNGSGVWDSIPFTKKSETINKVETSEYMSNVLDLGVSSVSYDTTTPQYKRYNINGRNSITMNTNFLDEDIHNTIQQLLMSDNSIIWETDRAINSTTSEVKVQQYVNMDKVQYTIIFEYANEEQSTIR